MIAAHQIRLTPFVEIYREALLNFELPEDQQRFTSLPIQKMNNPLVEESALHVVILNEENPIGYFTLEEGKKLAKYSSNKHAKLLTSFSITQHHQGKGYAKTALVQLPDFIKDTFPHVDEIVLGVNQGNVAAASLYRKIGFVDNGEVFVGPKGPQHIMHIPIV
ncbi:GNAT family N-acetyltransferase [Chryseomicrobium palamuruense]